MSACVTKVWDNKENHDTFTGQSFYCPVACGDSTNFRVFNRAINSTNEGELKLLNGYCRQLLK